MIEGLKDQKCLSEENQRIRTTEAATTPWAGITKGRRGDYQNPEHNDC